MTKITDEMKPCPFCGGEAERPHPEEPHGGMVQCKCCGAEAFGPKWNRRALSRRRAMPMHEDLIERFESAVNANGYRTRDAYTEKEYVEAKAVLSAALAQEGEPVGYLKPDLKDSVRIEPRYIPASERVHDWTRSVFTIPVYTHPAPADAGVVETSGKVAALIEGINAQAKAGSGWLLGSEEAQLIVAEFQRLHAALRTKGGE